jgi:beta-lactam-binding protein with PASTA domain
MIWAFSLTPSSDLPDNSRKVPSLVGQSYETAQNTLIQSDLAATMAQEASATVPKDKVTRTDPPAGTIAQPTDVIKVYVSTGPQPVTVPDVTNLPVADAQAAISALGLVPGSITKENSATIAQNLVLRTDPLLQAKAQTGDTINLFISSGLVTLPNLVGQSLTAASDLLQTASVQLVPIPTPDKTCPSTTVPLVTKQSQAPGDVQQKSQVALSYCVG